MRWHGAAAAKSGKDHAHPITRCSAVAQPENTGSRVLYLTLFSLQALEYEELCLNLARDYSRTDARHQQFYIFKSKTETKWQNILRLSCPEP